MASNYTFRPDGRQIANSVIVVRTQTTGENLDVLSCHSDPIIGLMQVVVRDPEPAVVTVQTPPPGDPTTTAMEIFHEAQAKSTRFDALMRELRNYQMAIGMLTTPHPTPEISDDPLAMARAIVAHVTERAA